GRMSGSERAPMSLRSQTFEFGLNALQLREQFPVENEAVGPVAGYKGPTQCIPRIPIEKLSQIPACRNVLHFAESRRARRCSLQSVLKFRGKRDTLSLTRKTR